MSIYWIKLMDLLTAEEELFIQLFIRIKFLKWTFDIEIYIASDDLVEITEGSK